MSSFVTPLSIFQVAETYRKSVPHLYKQEDTKYAGLIMLQMAVEIYLKALWQQENTESEPIHGHQCQKIYDKLSQGTKDKLENNFVIYSLDPRNPPVSADTIKLLESSSGQSWPQNFAEALAPFTHEFFVQARYSYEKSISNHLVSRVPELLGSLMKTFQDQEASY